MREIHGVADAEKVRMVNSEDGNYKVTVTDGAGQVILNIADATYPAGLSPDRARAIARLLIGSAKRVEKAKSGVQSR